MSNVCARINSRDVVYTNLGNEGVILNLRSKYYFTLNETGMQIWDLLTEGADEETIVAKLCDEYDVEPEACRRDLQELMRQFAAEGLILANAP